MYYCQPQSAQPRKGDHSERLLLLSLGFGFLVFGVVEYFLTMHRANAIYEEYADDFYEAKEDLTSDNEDK